MNLLRKVQIHGKWERLPVPWSAGAGGEKVYDYSAVMYKGVKTTATSGTFYLEYREAGRTTKTRRAVGDHPRDVKLALHNQASVLKLRAQGMAVPDAPQIRKPAPAGKSIAQVAQEFEAAPPIRYRKKSVQKYTEALNSFVAWSRKKGRTHVVQLDRKDLCDYMSDLVRKEKLSPSTAIDKAVVVLKLMNEAGGEIKMERGDWPKVTRPEIEIYSPEVLQELFARCNQNEFVRYQTFLLSGLREQEVMHLTWSDFDPRLSSLRVRKKPGFDPKTYEERTVPIPGYLVALLAKHRVRQREAGEDAPYIFATPKINKHRGKPGGQPDSKMLAKLKKLAKRAGLNCGLCAGKVKHKHVTCRTHAICQQFGLHKFRHTYASTLLQEGVDLKSLQLLLGHKELASTERYLHALTPTNLLAKINATDLATKFVRAPEPETAELLEMKPAQMAVA